MIVNVLEGSPPVATTAGPITFVEENNSSTFALSGTDVDTADSGHLSVVVTSLPTKSVLMQQGILGASDTAVTTVPTTLSNPVVYFVGDKLKDGSDSFTWQVVDLVNLTSAVSTVQATITHINHPPVAGVSISAGVENQQLVFNVYGQDPDNDMPLSLYISAAPASGSIYQSDGTTLITPTAANPVLVTDFNGQLIYVPPTNQYGYPIANFSMFVNDNSGYPNCLSTILTTGINITRVDLAPSVANYSASMPQNSQLSFTLNVTDPQGYLTYVTILNFPSVGTLYRGDGVTVISPSNPSTGYGNSVIYVPPNTYSAGTISFTYRATAVNSSLVSTNIGSGSIYVYQTISPPVFTGTTLYSIADTTNLTMLLTGYSQVGSYSIQIVQGIANTSGVIYVRYNSTFHSFTPLLPLTLLKVRIHAWVMNLAQRPT
jgi:hypothetical protein